MGNVCDRVFAAVRAGRVGLVERAVGASTGIGFMVSSPGDVARLTQIPLILF